MTETTSNLLVPLYFVHAALGTAVLAWWFLTCKNKTLKTFGLGLAGYALGLAAWTLLVITKPEELKPLILLGAIPFLLAHFAYAKVAYKNINFAKTGLLTLVVAGTIAATFIVRTFLYPSEAYFSDEGLLFFGLHPVASAFYIATIGLTFLPAITVVGNTLKKGSLRNVMQAGLTVLFINAVILVSSQSDTLLLINGYVMSAALLALWLTALTSKSTNK